MSFIVTKEHRRFTEFANVVRKEHTIGICFGDAGVGKTVSARRYESWDLFEPHLSAYGPIGVDAKKAAAADKARTVFYTPDVICRPRALADDIHHSAATSTPTSANTPSFDPTPARCPAPERPPTPSN